MAEAVAEAIVEQRHLVVQAGRAPASRWPTWCRPSSRVTKVVVSTATKALQDQLAGKDLPFLQKHLGTRSSSPS